MNIAILLLLVFVVIGTVFLYLENRANRREAEKPPIGPGKTLPAHKFRQPRHIEQINQQIGNE